MFFFFTFLSTSGQQILFFFLDLMEETKLNLVHKTKGQTRRQYKLLLKKRDNINWHLDSRILLV